MSQRVEVHKFGGTSVGDAARMQAVAQIIKEAAAGGVGVVLVASAMAGVTNELVAGAEAAAAGARAHALSLTGALLERHTRALHELCDGAPDQATDQALHGLIEELYELLRAVTLLGELTARSRDRVLATGEKLAVRLLALALRRAGVEAVALDADTFLETDDHFGEANPLSGLADRTVRAALERHLERGVVPVVTGFCGRAPDGATTTLGRGGSDFSATILAGALGADEVTIWTDVSGVFSANPRIVPEARVIAQLNYREAGELSFYGAKVLHQRTMIPVADAGIPVRIRNSMAPDDEGSRVDGSFTPGSHPVKAISAVGGQALVSIEGKGMAGLPGVAAQVFGALAREQISVTMISQSSSESSICLAVPDDQALRAEAALKRAFREALSRGEVEEVLVRGGVELVAAVGLGMAHTPGVAARVFSALGRRRINVLAIAQGSSELNISLALASAEVPGAIRALHAEFGLHREDTGLDAPRDLDLMLLGCGKIGRALVGLLERRAHAFERFGLRPKLVALADRSGHLFDPRGLDGARVEAALAAKAEGGSLAAQPGARAEPDAAQMVRAALRYRLSRPTLVDVSDSDDAVAPFLEALRGGCDVVTANKKPLADDLEAFCRLQETARERGRLLKAETTVGASLPVVDTLELLLATGDRLLRAEGCLSGTLGFVMTRLEEGAALSEAVAEAIERGYTEPDPVVDLSGADVARKALILGRLSGLALAEDVLEARGLVGLELAGLSRDALLERLRAEHDAPMAERVAAARAEGKVLRYVASVDPGRVVVGVRAVDADAPLGRLRGTDNTIVFESERYCDRPLVVTGPGAGVEVTAMGVLGDILRVAAERS